MITFEEVSFEFDGKKVVSGFSEEINPGEHVALMGESGSGKSTLMKALMGLNRLSAGTIRVNGISLDAHSIQKIRNLIAWVPQEVQLPYEYVREAMEMPFSFRVNHQKRFDEQKMFSLFDRLGLEKGVYDRRMQEISGGERQRLMLVLAVLLDKKILLLDEPTSAVDPQTREKMIAFLKELPVTLLAVTHDSKFAEACSRTLFIQKLRP